MRRHPRPSLIVALGQDQAPSPNQHYFRVLDFACSALAESDRLVAQRGSQQAASHPSTEVAPPTSRPRGAGPEASCCRHFQWPRKRGCLTARVRKSEWGYAQLEALAGGPAGAAVARATWERGAAFGTVRASPGSVPLSCQRRSASRVGPAPALLPGTWRALLSGCPAALHPVTNSCEERVCGLRDNSLTASVFVTLSQAVRTLTWNNPF